MTAKELRIGNYFFIGGLDRYVKVSSVFLSHFKCTDENGIDFNNHQNNIKPIELTEEILLKCGFELKGIIFRINNGFDNQFDINYSLSRDMFYYYSSKYGIYTEVEIKYLHQLQNLYFALTNEELNIQL